MPAVAVVAAAVASSFAVSAAVAGTLTALGAIAAIGSVVGAVGAVTGNKGLAMAGMVMGVVGGVGALAANAGLLGEAASAPLFGVDTAGSVGDGASIMGDVAGGAAAPAEAALPGAANITAPADASMEAFVDSFGELNPVEPAVDVTQSVSQATGEGTSIINGGSGADNLDLTNQSVIEPPKVDAPTSSGADVTGKPSGGVTGSPDAGTTVTGQADPNKMITGMDMGNPKIDLPMMSPPAGGKSPAEAPGMFSKILDFAKNNQMVTYGILQAGGSMLSGLTDPVKPAQINALNAQAEANRAAANLQTRQADNAGMAIPRATRPVGGNGLINQGA